MKSISTISTNALEKLNMASKSISCGFESKEKPLGFEMCVLPKGAVTEFDLRISVEKYFH